MVKIIFLDIDGVLNYAGMPNEDRASDKAPFRMLSKSRIAQLNELLEETGAQIVVTSAWRQHDPEKVQNILYLAGVVRDRIIGQTPVCNNKGNVRTFRGNEIYAWMQANRELIGEVDNYRDYVILDDDSDFLMWQANNFIQTDQWVGLSPQAAYKARRVLMRGGRL